MNHVYPNIELASLGSKTHPSGVNEDALAYSVLDSFNGKMNRPVAVFCVADGMTTLASPHLASSYAVRSAMAVFFSSFSPLHDRPVEMIIAANHFLLNHPTRQNFGTTLTTAVVVDGRIHIANIGDDRVYQVSDSQIVCLTRDHSKLAEELGRNPTYTEVKANKKSKKLSRSLGEKTFGLDYVFTCDRQVKRGDIFIICTDGLWTEFDEKELLSSATNHATAISLAEAAMKLDDTDDISLVLARF